MTPPSQSAEYRRARYAADPEYRRRRLRVHKIPPNSVEPVGATTSLTRLFDQEVSRSPDGRACLLVWHVARDTGLSLSQVQSGLVSIARERGLRVEIERPPVHKAVPSQEVLDYQARTTVYRLSSTWTKLAKTPPQSEEVRRRSRDRMRVVRAAESPEQRACRKEQVRIASQKRYQKIRASPELWAEHKAIRAEQKRVKRSRA